MAALNCEARALVLNMLAVGALTRTALRGAGTAHSVGNEKGDDEEEGNREPPILHSEDGGPNTVAETIVRFGPERGSSDHRDETTQRGRHQDQHGERQNPFGTIGAHGCGGVGRFVAHIPRIRGVRLPVGLRG